MLACLRGASATRLSLALLLGWSFLLRVWATTPELSAQRFWDERYGLENIRFLLAEGEIRPANGFHPSLSYLPQAALLAASEALHRATGWESLGVFRDGGFSPTAYLLCRLLQAVFGTLSIYLTYLAGKRLFYADVGLLGALLLSAVEWHIRQSVIYKPDILLVLTTLVSFLWSLDALERQTWQSYCKAGIGIGLAMASKFNGGPAGLPLVLAALGNSGWRRWDRWQRLALAAATAAAVFLILNPFLVLDPHLYARDFSHTIQNYSTKGTLQESSHAKVLWHGLATLVSPSFHGKLVGILALLGMLSVLSVSVSSARLASLDTPGKRLGPLMALTYVVGYGLLYALATTNLSPHNWLMVTPYTSHFAAWFVLQIWRWITARWPTLGSRRIAAAAAIPFGALLVVSPFIFVYRTVVPTTWALAERYLEEKLKPATERVIYCEAGERHRFRFRHGHKNMAVVRVVKDLARVPSVVLNRADAELVDSERISEKQGEYYQRLMAAAALHQMVRFEPAAFRALGTPVMVLVHPWREVGRPLLLTLSHPPGAPRQVMGSLPEELGSERLASVEIYRPKTWRKRGIGSVLVGGEPLTLASVGAAGARIFSERFWIAKPRARLIIHLRGAFQAGEPELRIWLHRWR
jgi:hypothetical protein